MPSVLCDIMSYIESFDKPHRLYNMHLLLSDGGAESVENISNKQDKKSREDTWGGDPFSNMNEDQ